MLCPVLAETLTIAVLCFETSHQNQCDFSPAGRELVAVSRSLLDFLLSSGGQMMKTQRSDALSSLIQNIHRLHTINNVGQDILASILTIVLIFRLREGPCMDWRDVDTSLYDCFKTGRIALFPQSSTTLVLELVLREDPEGDNKTLIVSIITHSSNTN